MANVIMTEAPGGQDAYQCPYCGHTYLAHVVDESGTVTAQTADAPRNCRRCASPMDVDAAQKYQDEMAEKAAAPVERTLARRRLVKV